MSPLFGSFPMPKKATSLKRIKAKIRTKDSSSGAMSNY